MKTIKVMSVIGLIFYGYYLIHGITGMATFAQGEGKVLSFMVVFLSSYGLALSIIGVIHTSKRKA